MSIPTFKSLTDKQRRFLERVLVIYNMTKNDPIPFGSKYPTRIKNILQTGKYYLNRANGFDDCETHGTDKAILDYTTAKYKMYKPIIDGLLKNHNHGKTDI